MIKITELVKDYGDDGTVTRALDGITFHIKKGEFLSIMGPSGSGKSTLLHILSFMDRPTSGGYEFDGRSMEHLTDKDLAHIRNEEMGFVFQSFNLMSRSSVYENVELPLLYNHHIEPSKRKSKIRSAIEAVGLEDKTFVDAGKLSGGQKQRVAIARALVNNPTVIFADEPTGNLDSKSGAQIMEILETLNSQGHTIILVTHETYTAEFADRLITLKDGKVESDEPIGHRRKTKSEFIK